MIIPSYKYNRIEIKKEFPSYKLIINGLKHDIRIIKRSWVHFKYHRNGTGFHSLVS